MKQQVEVMVVDDNPINLSLMEAMLEPEGYRVRLYESGEKCLEAVRSDAPDVILLDAKMPTPDGFQVVRLLKADEATRMIPVIMVTSLTDLADRVTAIEAGADEFLSKPVAKVELLARIRSLVKIKTFNDQLAESERRYRELVQDANVIIFAINGQGIITFMNEFGLSFFGYTESELIGKSEIETILPEFESTGRNLKQIASGLEENIALYRRYTHENMTKARRRVWVDWTNRVVVDRKTGKAGLLCVGVDVTAARRAEQEKLRQYARHKRRDILNDGLNRRLSQAELIGELQQLGVAMEAPFIVHLLGIPAEYMVAGPPDKEWTERQQQINLLIDFLQDSDVGATWQTPVGVAVIQSLANRRSSSVTVVNAKQASEELIKIVRRYWSGAVIGVGVTHSSEDAMEIAGLFEQARAALRYGPVLTPGKPVYHWQDLGFFQFVVKDPDSAQTRQFIQEHLGPILNKKQAKNTTDELATLEALVSGDSLQVIADRLYVHKQTVVFRKKKLADILGVDLDAPATRMNLIVAMKLLSMSS
jgi:PAS domain S-box-containing protein